MEGYNSLINELNDSLHKYYSERRNNGSYNYILMPVKKAHKFLVKEGIFILPRTKHQKQIPENKNPSDELKKLKSIAEEARNRIWEDNLGLIGSVAGRYKSKLYRNTTTFDELKSDGNSGLLRAIRRFNPNLGVPFPHYAMKSIATSIRRNFNERLGTIKLPINFSLNYKNIEYFENSFKEKFGYSPNDRELAKFVRRMEEYVKNMKKYKSNMQNVSSLNFPIFEEEDGEIIDMIGDEKSAFEDKILNDIILSDFVKKIEIKLSSIEKIVFMGRLKGKTLQEIGSVELNRTRERVRQLEERIMNKIKPEEEFKKILESFI